MKAAIVGLVRGYDTIEGYERLIQRNRLIHRNFNEQFDYPLLIFHEGNIRLKHQKVMQNLTPNITFIDISGRAFILPENIPNEWQKNLGYKHMCKFYGMQIYDILSDYDYFWRLDDDSLIYNKINYDVFDLMESNNYVYGFIHGEQEYHQETVETLPAFTRDYIDRQGADIKCGMDAIDAYYYYSNFTITSVKFWHKPEVEAYLKAIDDYQGIYRHRWGDAVIQTLALKKFAEQEKTHHFQDISYAHISHKWKNFQDRKNLGYILEKFENRFYKYYSKYLNWKIDQSI